MSNCRNCGAPHNNRKCEYCGTVYYSVAVPIKSILNKKEPTGLSQLTPLKKFILFVVGVVGVFIFFIVIKRAWQRHK